MANSDKRREDLISGLRDIFFSAAGGISDMANIEIEQVLALFDAPTEAMLEDIIEPNGRIGTDNLPDPYKISFEIQRLVKARMLDRASKYFYKKD